jgi:hypothetical protein
MRIARWPCWVLCLAWLAGVGCTALRELPRSEFAAQPERKHARVTTREGLVYEFDYVQVDSDTLHGFRERDTEGPVTDIATLPIPLDEVATFSVRSLDWYRTGLVGGGALVVVAAAGLAHRNNSPSGGDSGGGKGPIGQ